MVFSILHFERKNGFNISFCVGNICRCTGYRPILDAFKSLASDSCAGDIEDLTLDFCRMNKDQDQKNSCPSKGKCNRFNKFMYGGKFNVDGSKRIFTDDGKVWIKPTNLSALLKVFTTETINSNYMLVAGNTAHGKILYQLTFI